MRRTDQYVMVTSWTGAVSVYPHKKYILESGVDQAMFGRALDRL